VAFVNVRPVMVELFTYSWEVEAMPVIVRFVPVALVKVRPVIVEDVCQAFVDETVPAVSQPVEVALVKVRPCRPITPVTFRVPETFALPVVLRVATCRFPVPVALVNVRPWRPVTPVTFKVPETFALPVELRVAIWRFPEPVALVKVMPVEEAVPKVLEPVTIKLPTTCSVEDGCAVPMPTLPVFKTVRILDVVATVRRAFAIGVEVPMFIVPTPKFPAVEVAFTNQIFVDETVGTVSQPVPVALVNVRPVIVELFAYIWEVEAMPVIVRFVPVAFVKVRPVIVEDVCQAFVDETVPAVSQPVEVALVNVRPWRPVTPVTFKVPETFALPVVLRVATWRFPLPVAFVNVRPVEETLAMSVPAVMTPLEETRSWVEELTWKSMKLPEKLVGFAPMKVPEAEPAWIMFGPSCRSEEEARS